MTCKRCGEEVKKVDVFGLCDSCQAYAELRTKDIEVDALFYSVAAIIVYLFERYLKFNPPIAFTDGLYAFGKGFIIMLIIVGFGNVVAPFLHRRGSKAGIITCVVVAVVASYIFSHYEQRENYYEETVETVSLEEYEELKSDYRDMIYDLQFLESGIRSGDNPEEIADDIQDILWMYE